MKFASHHRQLTEMPLLCDRMVQLLVGQRESQLELNYGELMRVYYSLSVVR